MSLGQGCLTLVFASVSELKRERLAAESGLKVCVCVWDGGSAEDV